MKLSGSTRVHDLLVAFPFLEDFLPTRSARFEMLKNRMARATIGRVATLRTAASISGLDLDRLLEDIAEQIERMTGARPELEVTTEGAAPTRVERLEQLKGIIAHLHAGGDLGEARELFAKAVEDVEASEIAAMEEELIRGGLPVSEVQRLCDVHVGAFRQALDEHAELELPPGHPVHTYMTENRLITELANALGGAAREIAAGKDADENLARALEVLGRMSGFENHYQRKENQLFPLLERHGVTGPSRVMWGVHDQIRAGYKAVRAAAEARDVAVFATAAPAFARDIIEMVYKEEKILFPMSLETLSAEDWVEVRRGEDELGYVLAKPAAPWPSGQAGPVGPSAAGGLVGLMTGELSLDQVNLIFSHLPVDLSFVDETDTVRFYSEGPARIFPRSPAVIGRKVQNCHPPKSVHVVQQILDSFRAGTQSMAEFWIQLQGRFVHIRYLAIRDESGAYRGCLEVSQDVTEIRRLQGERRLLEWESAAPSRQG
jgi:uncharacterized protein